jgi:outer membrane lipoprotein-sorting protein
MQKLYRVVVWMFVIMAVMSLGAWAQEPTADEILALVEDKSIMGGEVGTMVATVRFEVAVEEGEATAYTFRVFSVMDVEGEPDKLLIVYLDPELVAGTMLLTHTPEEGDAQMWLYLPALGLVKELVTEESQGQEFISGSGISRSEIAEGFQYHEDYSPVLTGEEEIDGLPAYVLFLTPREGRETDWQSIKLWVYKEEFAVIRAEFTDSEGRFAKLLEGDDFYADSVSFFSHTITFQDLIGGGSSLITLLDREIADIPADYFVSENLPTLDLETSLGD